MLSDETKDELAYEIKAALVVAISHAGKVVVDADSFKERMRQAILKVDDLVDGVLDEVAEVIGEYVDGVLTAVESLSPEDQDRMAAMAELHVDAYEDPHKVMPKMRALYARTGRELPS